MDVTDHNMSLHHRERRQHCWSIGGISAPSLTWGRHSCRTCSIALLTGERSGFCCGPHGNRFLAVPALPPLPYEYNAFVHDHNISRLSRKLNLVFSFASLESTHRFPTPGPPSFVAIAGRTYHCIRSHHNDNSAIRWMLYDGFERSHIPYQPQAQSLPPHWIDAVQSAFLRVNPFVRQLHSFRNLHLQFPNQFPNASLIIEDSGSSEIAAIMCYDNTIKTEVRPRSLTISLKRGGRQTVPTVSQLWEPLAYPLFFPSATLGWGVIASSPQQVDNIDQQQDDGTDHATTQIWHYRARLLREDRFRLFGRLTNEYVVDMFSRDLECRLHYIRSNQVRIRAMEEDSALMGQEDLSEVENIYLPASFLGSWRWASNQISDSLAIAATYGPPTFFITLTCNGDWPEITSQLYPGQNHTDVPAVVCRVFKQKLSKLLHALCTMFTHAG